MANPKLTTDHCSSTELLSLTGLLKENYYLSSLNYYLTTVTLPVTSLVSCPRLL